MKKKHLIGILFLAVALSGCGLTSLTERISGTGEEDLLEITAAPTAVPERVYMDEMRGEIQSFDGRSLTILSGETAYSFDISTATVETSYGLIPGSSVSIIYEGQLSGQDTSGLHILKIADELNEKTELTEQVFYGRILQLTSDLLVLENEEQQSIVFSIPGCRTSFQNGAAVDRWIYVHYLGALPELSSDPENPADARFVRVTSLSDTESFLPEAAASSQEQTQTLYATVTGLSNQTLTLQPAGESTDFTLDLSQIPISCSAGITPGSGITLQYTGERTEEGSLAGLSVLSIQGEEIDSQKAGRVSTWLSGSVIGSTADTVTLQTADGARLIVRTDNVPNASTSSFEYGSSLRVTFHPAWCRETNVLASLRLED